MNKHMLKTAVSGALAASVLFVTAVPAFAAPMVPNGLRTRNEQQKNVQKPAFQYEDLKQTHFEFSSGVGGWDTTMQIYADGTFDGVYHDFDYGITGEKYPEGTVSLCVFDGKFGKLTQVDEYTWTTKMTELNYHEETGTEAYIDGMRQCYTDAYGLSDGTTFEFYMAGTPIEKLPEGLRDWLSFSLWDYDSNVQLEKLPFTAMYNVEGEKGFSSYNIIESFLRNMEFVEMEAESLGKEFNEGMLSQYELNQKAHEIYTIWDEALNTAWAILKETKEPQRMNEILVEERAWIKEKERKVNAEASGFEGGTAYPMVHDITAAGITKERVYKLIEYMKE